MNEVCSFESDVALVFGHRASPQTDQAFNNNAGKMIRYLVSLIFFKPGNIVKNHNGLHQDCN